MVVNHMVHITIRLLGRQTEIDRELYEETDRQRQREGGGGEKGER